MYVYKDIYIYIYMVVPTTGMGGDSQRHASLGVCLNPHISISNSSVSAVGHEPCLLEDVSGIGAVRLQN